MNFTKNHCRIGWVLAIAMAACNNPQKPNQPSAQPSGTPADSTAKVDTSSIEDTTAKNSRSNDSTVRDTGKQDTSAKSKFAAANQSMTLPVLDALFYEPDFAKELESKLQLSPAKIAELKKTAHASVAELSEVGSPDATSARQATEQYQQKIEALIGTEKAQQLLQLVSQSYSQGIEGLAPSQPNFVPKDTRIVVNAPAFRMDVFEKGRLIRSYKIAIGYPEFPLPTGMRRADIIIFNPSWIPPDEPWVHGKFEPGRKVSAASKLNPLGLVKIPIGLPSLIHGGKSPEMIGRLGSHGCVGLTNKEVLNLTPLILRLGQSDLSGKAIRKLERNRHKTEKVKLPVPVPVDLRYETIVATNGGLHIYRDVYERSTNTLGNARAVLATYGIKYEQLSPDEQRKLSAALIEMNRDARGRPIADNAQGDTLASERDTTLAGKSTQTKKGKVTSKIQGRKSIFVKLAALQGKGYPAPLMNQMAFRDE